MTVPHNAPPATPKPSLPPAPPGWLEVQTAKIRQISLALGQAETPDDVFRISIATSRSLLGFNRIGAWLFEPGRRSLKGTFGVSPTGEPTDERHLRIFDHGSIAPQMVEWTRPPHYYLRAANPLRDSEGGIISTGAHITAPLFHQGNVIGFFAADDLLESAAINDQSGHLLGMLADYVSVHYHHKLAEERAKAAQAASERSDAIKREFLGMLSHEVRTPLNAILGFAQLLTLESNSVNQVQLARTIEQSGDHLLNLLNSMMEYAHLAGEDLRDRFVPSHPVQVARQTIESFSELAAAKKIQLQFRHEGDYLGPVHADPIGLRQVLGNLIQNAIKFTRQGHVSLVVQTQPKPQDAVEFFFTVEDTGCGIAPEHLATIFKPFEQIDSSMTRSHGGIGMGLAIVERLVLAMGGHVTCASEKGKGSRFAIDFTFNCATDTPSVPQHLIGTRAPSTNDRSKIKFLVAEDDETNRSLLLSVLTNLGFPQPDFAHDGDVATTLISQRPYDVLILDLQMPGFDGLTLTRMVREGLCGPVNRDAPIIGVTAHANQYDRERCTSAGMNAFIEKPFKLPHLHATILQLISSPHP